MSVSNKLHQKDKTFIEHLKKFPHEISYAVGLANKYKVDDEDILELIIKSREPRRPPQGK